MGRPLKKDVNGVSVIRSFATTEAGIKLQGYFTADSGLQTDYQIIKQRGAKTFVVARQSLTDFAEGESITNTSAVDPTKFRTGKLVAEEPAADGEIRIFGYTAPAEVDANAVAIAKLTKRVATDFSGNRYTWYLENDSSADFIVLTAI
jgi:hypothetical protein